MTGRSFTRRIGAGVLLSVTAIMPLRGEDAVPDKRVERLIEVQDLADAGEAKRDFRLFLQAACLRALAGDLISIDADQASDQILNSEEDELSLESLLARAARHAPAANKASIAAAVARLAAGKELGADLCPGGSENLRGTGYVVRIIKDANQQQVIVLPLPRLKADEPVVITVRAGLFGRVTFELKGPKGLACRSRAPAARTAMCTASPPGGTGSIGGYSLLVRNDANLKTRLSVYVS